MTVSCVAAMGGFFIVAITEERGALLAGVALTSFSEGIGESTFLGYSAFYYHDVISTWSSGTGGEFLEKINLTNGKISNECNCCVLVFTKINPTFHQF